MMIIVTICAFRIVCDRNRSQTGWVVESVMWDGWEVKDVMVESVTWDGWEVEGVTWDGWEVKGEGEIGWRLGGWR